MGYKLAFVTQIIKQPYISCMKILTSNPDCLRKNSVSRKDGFVPFFHTFLRITEKPDKNFKFSLFNFKGSYMSDITNYETKMSLPKLYGR